MSQLETESLVMEFGGLRALDRVSIRIEPGEVRSVIGPNGAGKSTLLNVLTGGLSPSSGKVVFEGDEITHAPPYERAQRGIARIFQTPHVFPDLSVFDNVRCAALAAQDGAFRFNFFAGRERMRTVNGRSEWALEQIGLTGQAATPVKHLSHGDKRRVELGIGLALRPKLMLLDEPTAGMSSTETQETVRLLERIAGTGLTLVVIEHDMEIVFSISDRITVLHQGAVIADGPPDAIRGNTSVQDAYLGGMTA